MEFSVRTYSGENGTEKSTAFDDREWALSWAVVEARHLETLNVAGRVLVVDEANHSVVTVIAIQKVEDGLALAQQGPDSREPRPLALVLRDWFVTFEAKIQSERSEV